MCGIVGMAGDLDNADRALFRDLLDVCQIRGRDSTGVIKVDRQQNYGFVKRVGPPAYLFDSREYDTVMGGTLPVALVGHTRARTVGDVTIQSAHPFNIYEHNICGVHNGTLKNYYSLPEHRAGQVDSLTLYERLANVGPTKLFSDLEGAWACVWWDGEAKTLNFIRNDERPLWFTFSKNKRKMFWASEPWMLDVIDRKLHLWGGDKAREVYFPLLTDTHFAITIDPLTKVDDDVIKIQSQEKIPRKKVEPLKPVGGSVARPFSQWGLHLPKLLTTSAKSGATKPTTTAPSTKSSSTPSKNSSVPWKRPRLSVSGSKNTISPQSTSSDSFPKTKSEKQSDAPEAQPRTSSNRHTDLRQLANTWYITDMHTGREVSEYRFLAETKNKCCFCGGIINNLSQVAEILDISRFICTTCVTTEALS